MVAKDKGRKKIEEMARRLEVAEIVYVAVDDLKPNDYNPNRQSDHDFNLLLSSMRTDGFTVPIVVQKATNIIVDGEHRWRAARKLREEGIAFFDSIPVVYVNFTDEQMRVSTLRLNRARGSEDIDLSAQLIRDLEQMGALGWAQQQLMMDDIEIQRMINDIPAPEALASEEFGQAWVPEGAHHADEEKQGDYGRTIGGAPAIEGITEAAADRQRSAEKRLANAKTDEERVAALRDRDIHRVALTFSGEEALVVKRVLGDRPAERLVAMCREELAKQNA